MGVSTEFSSGCCVCLFCEVQPLDAVPWAVNNVVVGLMQSNLRDGRVWRPVLPLMRSAPYEPGCQGPSRPRYEYYLPLFFYLRVLCLHSDGESSLVVAGVSPCFVIDIFISHASGVENDLQKEESDLSCCA